MRVDRTVVNAAKLGAHAADDLALVAEEVGVVLDDRAEARVVLDEDDEGVREVLVDEPDEVEDVGGDARGELELRLGEGRESRAVEDNVVAVADVVGVERAVVDEEEPVRVCGGEEESAGVREREGARDWDAPLLLCARSLSHARASGYLTQHRTAAC